MAKKKFNLFEWKNWDLIALLVALVLIALTYVFSDVEFDSVKWIVMIYKYLLPIATISNGYVLLKDLFSKKRSNKLNKREKLIRWVVEIISVGFIVFLFLLASALRNFPF